MRTDIKRYGLTLRHTDSAGYIRTKASPNKNMTEQITKDSSHYGTASSTS